ISSSELKTSTSSWDDVAITELSFSREYTAAVEAKQVAQQEAQRAQFYVEKALQDQRHKIIQAEGEAEAAKMMATSQNRVYLNADSLVLNLQDKDNFNLLVLDSWCWTPGAGLLVLDSWCWTLGPRLLTPGAGLLVLDSWCWTPGAGLLVLDSCAGLPVLDSR
ncbi:hypothetical protein KUCAC02_035861, partial [Chaenocephalus aceratus]